MSSAGHPIILDVAPAASSGGDLDIGTIVGLVAFVGTAAFCAVLACLRPRLTFCSMEQKTE